MTPHTSQPPRCDLCGRPRTPADFLLLLGKTYSWHEPEPLPISDPLSLNHTNQNQLPPNLASKLICPHCLYRTLSHLRSITTHE